MNAMNKEELMKLAQKKGEARGSCSTLMPNIFDGMEVRRRYELLRKKQRKWAIP
jgi:hypothetical protein